jgi:hypothetical protein
MAIFQKMLEIPNFGQSYLGIHLVDLGESMLVRKVQYSVDCIFRGTYDPTGSLWGLETPTIELYKTSIKSLYTFRVFANFYFIFLILSRVNIYFSKLIFYVSRDRP